MSHECKLRREAGNPHKFITMGEIMLRLTPPNYEKIRMATSYEASYGGSEANIALALASLGVDSTFFTVVPDNSLGKSAIRMLRSNDVHCEPVIFSTPQQTPTHRMGTYYLETGYGIRASEVIYDRKHSAITEFDFDSYDLKNLLKDYTWLHLSGITPALGENCRKLVMRSLQIAKEMGLVTSFDGNFRSALHLWRDEEDHGKGDVKDGVPLQPDFEQQEEVFRAFVKRYPNLQCIARHVRYAYSGSENSLKAYMWYNGQTYESYKLTFNILDRVGAGDAFAGGLLYGMMNGYEPEEMLNFAVASSAIKHTIRGDANLIDNVAVIRNLMKASLGNGFDIKR